MGALRPGICDGDGSGFCECLFYREIPLLDVGIRLKSGAGVYRLTIQLTERRRIPADWLHNSVRERVAILLGGSNSNPWVQLFDTNLNFHLHFLPAERTFRIENRQPLPGEPSEYPYASGTAQPYAYGLVAIVPNLSHTGNVLLLEGVTNSGLQAAVSMLTDESLMSIVAEKAIRPDGTIRPAEFLVRTTGVGGDSAGVEIIGSRIKQ
jgi:hypothetical protein